jgi:membrane protein
VEKKVSNSWSLIRETATSWVDHKATRLGAALAYYSIFSLGPLLVVAISVAGLFFGADATRDAVSGQLRGLLGESGSQAVNTMLAGTAGHSTAGILSTLLGVGTLLFAAIGVVVQLKDALNTVWDVEPPSGGGVWTFIRTYLVSLAGVLGVGFLLLVSMLISTALAAIGKFAAPYMPEFAFQTLEFAVSFGVITALFAMMYKWLPDATIAWRDVWVGAAVTALLFDLGKLAIGLYIGKQGLESTFGAAASIVVVLIWVYYSAQIILFGAEFTHVYALRVGSLKGTLAARKETRSAPNTVALDPETLPSAPQLIVIGALCLGLYMGYVGRTDMRYLVGSAKRERRPAVPLH